MNMMEKDIVDPESADKNLTFYYNREARLEKAPQNVRDYYANPTVLKPGLIRVLVRTRANRALLFTIVALAVFITVWNRRMSPANSGTLGGANLTLSAFSFDDTLYVSIELKPEEKKSIEKNSIAAGQRNQLFEAEIACIDKSGEIQDIKKVEGIFQISGGKETFLRTTFDNYDIIQVEALVTNGSESAALKTSVARQ
ncbi:MAG: hypothetical protein Ta2A_16570 [Treponemataceae bacterium]|nr:MAG: hypothetical protein Ta2A_16570 [Treponemataceae bacterium]